MTIATIRSGSIKSKWTRQISNAGEDTVILTDVQHCVQVLASLISYALKPECYLFWKKKLIYFSKFIVSIDLKHLSLELNTAIFLQNHFFS